MARPQPGDIVSRRKGFVMHRGVSLGGGRVLHNTPFRGEHTCSEDEFRAGKRMYVSKLDMETRRRALARAERGAGRGYNLLTNNCEHTASRTVHGKAESPQLKSWIVGTGLALATFAVTRHPVPTAAAYALGRKLGGRSRLT